nr:MAG TPA: hypothetical protein [Caudoviricetes sp.]
MFKYRRSRSIFLELKTPSLWELLLIFFERK